ncbi:hypothetical protein HDV02_001497 [Globomyces sp. JEL0801]|nr:hypothetical protein HDV02_001497 [Globomyces sp. JEL0801]
MKVFSLLVSSFSLAQAIVTGSAPFSSDLGFKQSGSPQAKFVNKGPDQFYKFAAVNTTKGRILYTSGGTSTECYNIRLNEGEGLSHVLTLSIGAGIFFFLDDDCPPNGRLGGTPPIYEAPAPVSALVAKTKDGVYSFRVVEVS